VGPREGEGGEGPGASPAQRPPPPYVPETPPTPIPSSTPVHGAQHCLGARCVTAELAAPCPHPWQGLGPAGGPAGVKADRKQALVRHRMGQQGGPSPNVPPASSTGSGEQLGGAEEGRARRQCPSPGPPSCPTGQIMPHLHEGSPNPQPRGFQRPPACPWTLLLFCPCGGGAGPDRPCTRALSAGLCVPRGVP